MAENKNIKGSINSLNTYHTDAYQIAVANGFEGSEAEWLDSLIGKSAYEIAVNEGKYTGTEAEFGKALAKIATITYDGSVTVS